MIPEKRTIGYIRKAAMRIGYGPDELDTVIEAVRSPQKRRSIADVRNHAMYLARKDGFSYNDIGEAFGRTHGTAMSGIARAEREFGALPSRPSLAPSEG